MFACYSLCTGVRRPTRYKPPTIAINATTPRRSHVPVASPPAPVLGIPGTDGPEVAVESVELVPVVVVVLIMVVLPLEFTFCANANPALPARSVAAIAVPLISLTKSCFMTLWVRC